MKLRPMIAFCGVDCAACTDLASGACPGCRKSEWPEGDACPPVACCLRRKLDFCGECGEFPCEMMTGFYEESESHAEALLRMRALRDIPGDDGGISGN